MRGFPSNCTNPRPIDPTKINEKRYSKKSHSHKQSTQPTLPRTNERLEPIVTLPTRDSDRGTNAWVYQDYKRTFPPDADDGSTKTKSLRQLTVGLVTADTAGRRPGEVSDRNDEEAVGGIGDTSQSVVPSSESSEESEETTGFLDPGVRGAVLGEKVGDAKEEEGQV